MRIQIIGPNGMLGQAVWNAALQAGVEAVQLFPDLTQIARLDASVVINCAGLVKQCLVSPSKFMWVNAYGPHYLAEVADRSGARLIHISTDCVFTGPGPHAENDIPDASDIYALSKRAGEVLRPPHLTIRTSFVGWGKRGLLTDLASKNVVTASAQQLWSGHMVKAISNLLIDLARRPDVTGLLHVPGEFQSRWDLDCRLVKHFGLKTWLVRDDAFVTDRRLISTRWEALGLDMPTFQDQLDDSSD